MFKLGYSTVSTDSASGGVIFSTTSSSTNIVSTITSQASGSTTISFNPTSSVGATSNPASSDRSTSIAPSTTTLPTTSTLPAIISSDGTTITSNSSTISLIATTTTASSVITAPTTSTTVTTTTPTTPTTAATTTSTITTISAVSSSPTTSPTTSTTVTTTDPTTTTATSTKVTTGLCEPLNFIRINLISVQSEAISITWDTNNVMKQLTFSVTITAVQLNTDGKRKETEEKSAEFNDLKPDIEYHITIETTTCGQLQSITRRVRTIAVVLKVSTRITNVQFEQDLEDKQSKKFKDFERNFTADLVRGFNENFKELYERGSLRIKINSIRNGSVLVDFEVAVSTNVTAPIATVSDVLTKSLNTSEMFNVDLQNTSIVERDSCQPGLNDCSANGTCIRLNATYTCQCNAGFSDTSPNTPGRICEDIDECQTGNHTCSDLAVCTNTPGNFTCGCFQGILDSKPSNPGTQCKDPNNCFTNEDPCAVFQCLTNNSCPSRRMLKTIITLKSKTFTNDLRNPGSEAYSSLSSEIRNAVVSPVRTTLQDNTFNITIFGFQNGSVVANILSSLNNTSITAATLQMAIASAVRTIDPQASVNVTGTLQVTTLAPTMSQTVSTLQTPADNSGFKVAVIVLGVILGVALLLIVAITLAMVCMKRKSGQYLISSSDMLQRFNYTNM
ncbi:hypothetical protein chiPu_0014816 [Chiloscyllium punctatum]|uniref:EGF-like domain-containing protein n=1 Tax=Chiloscyllium punctatum TaxID=137246 RepID=A0A401T0Y4_CHIPU|nr:hypothetical protein [Chiloscyllium punctatum]